MKSTNKTPKQLNAKADWYLQEQLHVTNPNNWELITVEDNLFFDKNKIIVGEPDFAFINQKENECLVILNIPRINLNLNAKRATTSAIERTEENHARVLSHLVSETCFEKWGKYPSKISTSIIYADFSQIKVSQFKNSETLIELSAKKVCNFQQLQMITAENLAGYMTNNPFILVVSEKDYIEDIQEWDTYF